MATGFRRDVPAQDARLLPAEMKCLQHDPRGKDQQRANAN